MTTKGDGPSPDVLARTGAEHLARYRELDAAGEDGVVEVELAVTELRAAVHATAGEHPYLPAYRYNLALALQSRYDAVGEPSGDDADLRAAIDVLATAVTSAGVVETPYEATLRYGLGAALRRLHQVTRDAEALRRAVGMLGDALAIGADFLDVADCRYEYGRALLTMAEDDDDGAVLDEAVRALGDLAEGIEPEAPERAAYLDAAGSARLLRYERTGNVDDLEAARRSAELAVELQRQAGRLSAAALTNLANALYAAGIRLAVGGDDLDRAVTIAREALGIARAEVGPNPARRPQAADRLAGICNNLAGILLSKLERTGDLADLDEIVELCEEATGNSPPGTTQLAVRSHQSAVARRTRYLRLDDVADLDAAISAHQVALACPAPDSDRRAMLDSWGNTLRTRFDRDQDPGSLREAITAFDEALAGLDPESPDRGTRLNNLGAALAALAQASEDPAAAERAVTVLQDSVAIARPGTLERLRALVNLGNVRADQYGRYGAAADRRAAEAAYEEIRRSSGRHAAGEETLLQAGLNAGDWALERRDWSSALTWFELALDAVDELLVVQRRRADKESWLRDVRGASVRAAQAAIAAGDLPRAATLLERGRATMLNEATQQAGLDLDRLDAAGAHDLRLRFENVRTVLGLGQAEGALASGRSRGAVPTTDLRALRDEVRRVPGFESFMTAPTFRDLSAAAGTIPLVYLSSTGTAGVALIVRGDSVDHVELSALTDDAVRRRVDHLLDVYEAYLTAYLEGDREVTLGAREAWRADLDDVGAWLWTAIGRPLLSALSPQAPEAAVQLVAGGLLGLLPVHGAWRRDPATPTKRRYLLDDLTISYTPSARALTVARRRERSVQADRLLTIAAPRSETLPPLPNTAAEAAVAEAGFGPPAPPPFALADATASVDAVMNGLRNCDVVHFGCHGQADLSAPLASALLLTDDARLSLGDILGFRTQMRLAVLSACETGRPGTRLPDEVVSLPTGLIQAGAAGVVSTGWAVSDGSTLALMTEFYRRWRWLGEEPGVALKGAQVWLRNTPNREKSQYWERAIESGAGWLPASTFDALQDVYLMREPEALDDAAMDVWAAFSHIGI